MRTVPHLIRPIYFLFVALETLSMAEWGATVSSSIALNNENNSTLKRFKTSSSWFNLSRQREKCSKREVTETSRLSVHSNYA